jgi:peptidyl-prolyl cis-trans isomerase A (cyclophilin A)
VFQVGGEAQQIPLRNLESADPVTANLVLMNMHRVSRYSAALHVFEFATGLLSTHVTTDQHGRMSILMKLVENAEQIVFAIDPRSMIPLAGDGAGAAQFNSGDQRLRIPTLEVNENGQVYQLSNVVLRLIDESELRFALESYE